MAVVRKPKREFGFCLSSLEQAKKTRESRTSCAGSLSRIECPLAFFALGLALILALPLAGQSSRQDEIAPDF